MPARLMHWFRLALLWFALGWNACAFADSGHASIRFSELPPEAQQTLTLIARDGPFPYRKDGSIFGNFERQLPLRPRGHYREYTVPTPGARNRGARRIIQSRDGVAYYTADHYRSFRQIRMKE